MAEGQTETIKPISLESVEDPHTGLTHYLLTDENELDPNGEPIMVELTASEFFELSQNPQN